MTWPMVKLENLVSITSGFAFKSNLFSESDGVPLIRIRDVVRGETETFYTGEYSNEFIINNGDILIGMDGDFNRARWKGGRALLNQRVCRIKADESNLCDSYLYHFLPKALDSINEKTHAVTVKHLSVKGIRDIKIPLPPLTEQKRIAAILDKADAIRQKRQQAIALADQFLRSVFLDMFGDPVTNPKGWRKASLTDFGEFKNGLNYTNGETGEHIFCIGVGDFRALDRIEGTTSLSEINLSSLPSDEYILDSGDILFVRSNGNKELIGRNIIVYPQDKKITFSGFCIRYRIKNRGVLNSIYLSHCLKAPSMRKLLLTGGQGANIQNISQKTLSELKIPMPPIELQETYQKMVNQHQQLTKKTSEFTLGNDAIFNSLSQKAFSGQL